jgi:hypothetical protein
MKDYHILFQPNATELSNSQLLIQLTELFSINWRNIILLLIYFIALLTLDIKIIHWLTKNFSNWHSQTITSWGIIILFTLLPILPLWRLTQEEGPHFSYNLSKEKITSLVPTHASIVKIGMGINLGGPLASRKIYWQIDGSSIHGSTPYLPTVVTMSTPIGTGVWVGIDPTGNRKPLFLGFEK